MFSLAVFEGVMDRNPCAQIPRGKLPKIGKQKRPLYNREEARALMTDPCSSSFDCSGPRATVEASHALFEHARSARADFPGSRYVAADLGAQVRLKQLLDRAAHAFAIR